MTERAKSGAPVGDSRSATARPDAAPEDGRRARGSLEREVVAALRAATGPLSTGQVRGALGNSLAYTTVMTVLGRLTGKGLVTRSRSGRGFVYRAVPDDAEVTARQMRRLLDAGGDRAAVLSRFVGVLSAADEALLADLLRRSEHQEGTG